MDARRAEEAHNASLLLNDEEAILLLSKSSLGDMRALRRAAPTEEQKRCSQKTGTKQHQRGRLRHEARGYLKGSDV